MKKLICLMFLLSSCCDCPSSICQDHEGVKKLRGEYWIYCNDGSTYDRKLKEFR